MKKVFFVVRLVAGVLLLLFLHSCKTSKQTSDKALDKALRNDTANVLGRLRKLAPCITGVTKTDSAKYIQWKHGFDSLYATIDTLPAAPITPDTILVKEKKLCPDLTTEKNYYKSLSNAYLRQLQDIRTKVNTIPAVHDSTGIKDSADVFVMQKTLEGEIKRRIKAEKWWDFWFIWAMITTVLSLLLGIGLILLIKLPKQIK